MSIMIRERKIMNRYGVKFGPTFIGVHTGKKSRYFTYPFNLSKRMVYFKKLYAY